MENGKKQMSQTLQEMLNSSEYRAGLMISIHPQHVKNILEWTKKYEVRTWKLPIDRWIYIAVSKHKNKHLYVTYAQESKGVWIKLYSVSKFIENEHDILNFENLTQKVVARFKVGNIRKLTYDRCWNSTEDYDEMYMENGSNIIDELLHQSKLTYDEIEDYGQAKTLYFHEIKVLEVFDNPKKITDFVGIRRGTIMSMSPAYTIKKLPQKYQYVYLKESE